MVWRPQLPRNNASSCWARLQVLHEHLTTSLCQTVFQQTRTTERERRWSLEALASFWTEVILRAPQSLTQAIEEAATRQRGGLASCPGDPRSLFPTLPELELAFLCQPL